MNFNDHSKLRGQHAFLGASKYHWLNYDPNKIAEAYRNFLAVAMGTRLHEYAAESIDLGQRLPKSHKTLNKYAENVNPSQNQNGGSNTYNFNQYNYSPKALSRIDLYRQTNNQFAMMKERGKA